MSLALISFRGFSCESLGGCRDLISGLISSWSTDPAAIFSVAILAMLFSAAAAFFACVQVYSGRSKLTLRLRTLGLSYMGGGAEGVDSVRVELVLENSGKLKKIIRSLEVFALGTPDPDSCAEPQIRVLALRYKNLAIEGYATERAEYIVRLPEIEGALCWNMVYAKILLESGELVESNYGRTYISFFQLFARRFRKWVEEA